MTRRKLAQAAAAASKKAKRAAAQTMTAAMTTAMTAAMTAAAKWSAVFFRKRVLNPALAGLLALIVAAAGYTAWTVNRPLGATLGKVIIKPGDTLSGVAEQLIARGVIGETFTLKLLGRMGNRAARIQSGEYLFPPETSLRKFVSSISAGRGRAKLKVTIIEGWTFKQMRERLQNARDLKQDSANMSSGEIMAALGRPGTHPEGRFAPDTYHYVAGASDLSIYRAALALQQRRLNAHWDARSEIVEIKKRDHALILASIIEKESTQPEEQRLVSGVFHNRLKKRMRLQADPTVVYGVGDAYDGNITRAHLRTDTPYNTYTRGGLPPTPISLPGESALHAAVNPEKTSAYYFVSKGGGLHHFSETLKQHNRAVRKYTRLRKRG